MKRLLLITLFVFITSSMAACSPGQLLEPTITPTPTNISTPTPTATPTPSPTPTPTQIGGSSGQFMYIGSIAGNAPLPNGYSVQFTGSQLRLYNLQSSQSEELINPKRMTEKIEKGIYNTTFFPSPDRQKVVIVAYTAIAYEDLGYQDAYEYYIASIDLNTILPILDTGAKYIQWKWSPDSSMLIGDAVYSNQKKAIFRVNSDGSELTKLLEASNISDPEWSRDGSKIYYLQKGVPMIMDIDGTNNQLFGNLNTISTGPLMNFDLSTDGKKTAFVSTGKILYTANNDFSNEVSIGLYSDCEGNFPLKILGWSTDSQYFLIKSTSCVFVNLGSLGRIPKITTEYTLLRTEDGERVDLVGNSERKISELCGWSPDGRFTYTMKEDDNYLVLVDLERLDESDAEIKLPYSGGCPYWIP
jgi:hypothetical protein